MVPGVADDAARPLQPETREYLGRQFFERDTGLGVTDHAISQDARANHSPLAGNTPWNALYVGTFGPVDHVNLHFRGQRSTETGHWGVGYRPQGGRGPSFGPASPTPYKNTLRFLSSNTFASSTIIRRATFHAPSTFRSTSSRYPDNNW